VLRLHAKRAIILLQRLDTDVQLVPNLHDGFHAHVYVYDMIRMVASIHKHGDKATSSTSDGLRNIARQRRPPVSQMPQRIHCVLLQSFAVLALVIRHDHVAPLRSGPVPPQRTVLPYHIGGKRVR
jgi:hypothetical protein